MAQTADGAAAVAQNLTASDREILENRGHKIIKFLGKGGYATVFLSEFTFAISNTEPKVMTLACKIVDRSAVPKAYVEKFLPRELDITSKVFHPHIIHTHSIFQHNAKYYIIMKYAELGDLLEYLLKNGEQTEQQTKIWIYQVGIAIQYLHTMDIVHRDLKCENILLSSNLNAKLSDFGFARSVADLKNGELSTTFCGSLAYAPPEIIKGLPYDPKYADVWSLGCILFTCLNKRLPFDDKSTKILYESQIARKMRFKTKVSETISNDLKALIQNMLHPEVRLGGRIDIDEVMSSPWFISDPRLARKKTGEMKALEQAKKYAAQGVGNVPPVTPIQDSQRSSKDTKEKSKKKDPGNDDKGKKPPGDDKGKKPPGPPGQKAA